MVDCFVTQWRSCAELFLEPSTHYFWTQILTNITKTHYFFYTLFVLPVWYPIQFCSLLHRKKVTDPARIPKPWIQDRKWPCSWCSNHSSKRKYSAWNTTAWTMGRHTQKSLNRLCLDKRLKMHEHEGMDHVVWSCAFLMNNPERNIAVSLWAVLTRSDGAAPLNFKCT